MTAKIVLPALLALAACDGGTQGAGVTVEETAADERAVDAGALADGETFAPAGGADEAANRIPASIQGRWGLTGADCEPGRPDAKGLLTISGDKLEFYESVGTLDDVEQAGPARIRASFDFTGEGMTWEREILLELEDGGEALVRQEYGADAAPDPLRYARCGEAA